MAPSQVALTGKGLTPRSWLSFSSFALFMRIAERVPSGHLHRCKRTPHASQRCTSLTSLSPESSLRTLARTPRWDFHPFDCHGSPCGESFPVARFQHALWDRTCGLLSKRGLLAGASLERGEPLSWHHALRAFDATVDKTAPLARLVTEFTGCQSPK